MMSRPSLGGGGSRAGRHCAGCAAATAVLNRPSRKARGEVLMIASLRTRALLSMPRADGVSCLGRPCLYLFGMPNSQAWRTAMTLDDKTRTELEAAAFRRLL